MTASTLLSARIAALEAQAAPLASLIARRQELDVEIDEAASASQSLHLLEAQIEGILGGSIPVNSESAQVQEQLADLMVIYQEAEEDALEAEPLQVATESASLPTPVISEFNSEPELIPDWQDVNLGTAQRLLLYVNAHPNLTAAEIAIGLDLQLGKVSGGCSLLKARGQFSATDERPCRYSVKVVGGPSRSEPVAVVDEPPASEPEYTLTYDEAMALSYLKDGAIYSVNQLNRRMNVALSRVERAVLGLLAYGLITKRGGGYIIASLQAAD